MIGKGALIEKRLEREVEDIKKNIRIIAEKLGLKFEAFCIGDYLLEKQKSCNKIEELEENIKCNIERIERVERLQFESSMEEIKQVVDLQDFEGKFLTFKKSKDYESGIYRVYSPSKVYIGAISYMPIYNEHRFFVDYDAEITLNYNMLLELTGFIDKLNHEKGINK